MQQPYGSGLILVPEGLGPKFAWAIKRALRVAPKHLLRPLDPLGLERLRITELIWVKDRIDWEIKNYRTLHPPQTVDLALPGDREFLQRVKYYKSGKIDLGEIFVCEVPGAFYYPHLGIVANESFEVFGDSVLLPHRFRLSPAYRSFRPLSTTFHKGPVSSIQRIDSYNFWHWMADCLPQLLTLEQYMEGEPLTLLMSDDLGGFQRETLALVLPSTFRIEFVPSKRWIKTDRFILPSYLTGMCSGYLPEGYYDEIRRRMTKGLGLPETGKPELRIYLARGPRARRRVSNEAAVIELLSSYGFTSVRLETMSMRDQVDLFQRAEIIVGPHSAGLGGMVFAPGAKLLVIYPEKMPGEYFYTMARSLGIEHFGLTHDVTSHEDFITEFSVDLVRLEAMLRDNVGLVKRQDLRTMSRTHSSSSQTSIPR